MSTYFNRKAIIAGLSTFFTLAYILVLYPQMMSEGGFDFGASLVALIATLVLSTLFLAVYADFPAVIGPGLSVVAYLIYSAIQKEGLLPSQALGVVFWSGLFVFLITLFKIRQTFLLHLPQSIKFSAIGGIGLFLICIGIKNLNHEILFSLSNGITIFGLFFFWFLHSRKINSAFLLTILLGWLLGIAFQISTIDGIAALPPAISPSLLTLDFSVILDPSLWGALLSVFLISLFDSSASLTALARLNHQITPKGAIEKVDQILIPDGVGSMLSGLLGATSLTFMLESSSGIKSGGKTGATAIVASVCCVAALFLFPLISSIPLFATTPALIAIGVFMALEAKEVNWKNWTDAIPALITLVTIPVTFSIYEGFAYGFISYALIKALTGKFKEVHPICWGLTFLFALHLMIF